MICCVQCQREMRVVKNGVGMDYGRGHVYSSDLWECPQCHAQVLNANRVYSVDTNYEFNHYYVVDHKAVEPNCSTIKPEKIWKGREENA